MHELSPSSLRAATTSSSTTSCLALSSCSSRQVRRRTCLLRNVCKGPNPNQILYFEDPVIGALPAEHRIAGLQGGMGNVNAWTYTEEEEAQGWRPTVMQGRVIAAAALQPHASCVSHV